MRKSRENGLFLNVPDEQWNDWKWQVENRIETLEDLKKYVNLTEEEEEGIKATWAGCAWPSPRITFPLSILTIPTTPSVSRPYLPSMNLSSLPMKTPILCTRISTPPARV
ncbi:MAG: hypothetical protein V8Q85_07665 [Christensenellales bacterium]